MLSVPVGSPSSDSVPVRVKGLPNTTVCAKPGLTVGATFVPLEVGVGVAVTVGVGVTVGVRVAVEVGVGVGVVPGVGVGGSPTVIVTVVLPVKPDGSLTVSLTGYVPADTKPLVAIDCVELVPSWNSHR